MSQSDRLLLGVITGAKGIRGELKVKSFTEFPEDIAAYGPLENKTGETTFDVSLVGMSKSQPVIRIKGVTDRNQAEALKGQELYVPRDRLPEIEEEDAFYHTDLVGLDVINEDGNRFGRILRLNDFGGGDILEIVPEGKGKKSSVLVPFTKEMVPVVDLEKGHIVVNLPDDFFEVPDKEPAESSDGSR
ncbi:ribosome maturation factor RimM [Sneathiella limimaris]|uniref:ribosome maturation factor RimM n=1 Tax=Sneathiella limimaris TaxID=1964213 RepID=UPI00146E543D|nr:ribosome maturation factor RimM [Sneathiella limimaris]